MRRRPRRKRQALRLLRGLHELHAARRVLHDQRRVPGELSTEQFHRSSKKHEPHGHKEPDHLHERRLEGERRLDRAGQAHREREVHQVVSEERVRGQSVRAT